MIIDILNIDLACDMIDGNVAAIFGPNSPKTTGTHCMHISLRIKLININ